MRQNTHRSRKQAEAAGQSGRSCGSGSAISKISFVTKGQLKDDDDNSTLVSEVLLRRSPGSSIKSVKKISCHVNFETPGATKMERRATKKKPRSRRAAIPLPAAQGGLRFEV